MSGSCNSSDSNKDCAEVSRMGAFFGKRSRNRLKLGVCYKILTGNSGSDFSSDSTINGCGEILKWKAKNKRSASLFLQRHR